MGVQDIVDDADDLLQRKPGGGNARSARTAVHDHHQLLVVHPLAQVGQAALAAQELRIAGRRLALPLEFAAAQLGADGPQGVVDLAGEALLEGLLAAEHRRLPVAVGEDEDVDLAAARRALEHGVVGHGEDDVDRLAAEDSDALLSCVAGQLQLLGRLEVVEAVVDLRLDGDTDPPGDDPRLDAGDQHAFDSMLETDDFIRAAFRLHMVAQVLEHGGNRHEVDHVRLLRRAVEEVAVAALVVARQQLRARAHLPRHAVGKPARVPGHHDVSQVSAREEVGMALVQLPGGRQLDGRMQAAAGKQQVAVDAGQLRTALLLGLGHEDGGDREAGPAGDVHRIVVPVKRLDQQAQMERVPRAEQIMLDHGLEHSADARPVLDAKERRDGRSAGLAALDRLALHRMLRIEGRARSAAEEDLALLDMLLPGTPVGSVPARAPVLDVLDGIITEVEGALAVLAGEQLDRQHLVEMRLGVGHDHAAQLPVTAAELGEIVIGRELAALRHGHGHLPFLLCHRLQNAANGPENIAETTYLVNLLRQNVKMIHIFPGSQGFIQFQRRIISFICLHKNHICTDLFRCFFEFIDDSRSDSFAAMFFGHS